MAIYGLVRSSLAKKEELAGSEMADIVQAAEKLGGGLKGVFADPGSTDRKTGILSRPVGKEMLETLQAGDTLIVTRLARLGYSMRRCLQDHGGLARTRGTNLPARTGKST